MDYQLLDDPQGHILDQGGYIAVALLNDEPVGTCALLKMTHGHFDYELAKMGVAPSLQGQGVGLLLGEHIIAKAKALGAKSIFIESNTVLRPAINLYKKLGFKEIERIKTPYNRCNIQMALKV